MIQLNRINGKKIYVNPDKIRYVECSPDTLITFVDGKTLIVKNTPAEITKKMVEIKQEDG